MKFSIAAIAAVFVASCLFSHVAWADDGSEDDKPRSSKLTEEQKARIAKKEKDALAKRKAASKIKLISLNGASVAELKTLPGISDKEAQLIIAGRPYGSKAWLTTKGVLDPLLYASIQSLVVAGQPSKEDAAKMPEVFGKKK